MPDAHPPREIASKVESLGVAKAHTSAVTVLVLWNALFMFQWAWGLVPKRGPIEWGVMARQQITEAPSEVFRAARLFFTDRGELIRIVQEQDVVNIEEGDG